MADQVLVTLDTKRRKIKFPTAIAGAVIAAKGMDGSDRYKLVQVARRWERQGKVIWVGKAESAVV